MLHAFDADTGYERFAYVPNLVFDNLSSLAATSFSHLFYVDMTPYAQSRVYAASATTDKKTLLVGGLGKGGKGYYCLDISDADDIDVLSDEDDVDDIVLWEYPKSGVTDADMGYSFSSAYLVKTNSTDNPWVVIFGNGYDSTNGHSVLYVLDALTGTLLHQIDTGGTSASNGLSTPVIIDVNNDNKADYAYAGDLEGNLWKFDLTSDTVTEWKVAYYSGTTAMPVFSAGSLQPITSRPDVMRHPYYDGYLVIFGTGRYLSSSDRLDTSQQTVYGIWDYGDDTDDDEYVGTISSHDTGVLSSGLKLVKQDVLDVETTCGEEYRILSDNVVWNPTNTNSDGSYADLATDSDTGENDNPDSVAGWFFDFPESGDDEAGERVIKDVTIYSDRVIVISFIPNTSLCSGGGNSYFYVFNSATGGRTDDAQIDVDGDGDIDDSDLCSGDDTEYSATGTLITGMAHVPKIVTVDVDENVDIGYVSTSAGTIEEMDLKGQHLGVYYWREKKSD
jgi:type IV pilus assembly protein PilY1